MYITRTHAHRGIGQAEQGSGGTVPIASLNTFTHKWTIQVRPCAQAWAGQARAPVAAANIRREGRWTGFESSYIPDEGGSWSIRPCVGWAVARPRRPRIFAD